MEGASLAAGSVIGLEGIRNPIMVARAVMDLPHVMLTNIGARRIAEAQDLPSLPLPDKQARDRLSSARKKEKCLAKLYRGLFSTVGAVALDGFGSLASGASTGGISAMLPGRVGDTPIIGAGIYAENSLGAASCTGIGEYIIRLSLAKEVCMNMKVMSPAKAASFSLRRLLNIGGEGGIILVNRSGQFSIVHTTAYLASGYADTKGIVVKEGFKKI
jgi:beta-aspartyl-peptidase (threonine type)